MRFVIDSVNFTPLFEFANYASEIDHRSRGRIDIVRGIL